MRQSIAQIEEAFAEEAEAARIERQIAQREAVRRSRRRELARVHKRGTWRFVGLVLVLTATAVLVTIAMFQALYIVMG